MKKIFKRILICTLSLAIIGLAVVVGINGYVCLKVSDNLQTVEETATESADCILILGCQVKAGGIPSDMLSDRLKKGIELYNEGAAPKLLMSGDHTGDYNEVSAMKQYAVNAGIDGEDIFMDHSGYSTYESIYRAKHLFGVGKVIIVTQEYHLYRALYIAESLGLDAVGVAADKVKYVGQTGREIREILARLKDFGQTVIKPEIKLSDKAVPIGGDGNLTNMGEEFV